MPPPPDSPADLTVAYAATRTGGALTLAPVAGVGPGRTARLAFALGAALGVACLGGYVAVGLFL